MLQQILENKTIGPIYQTYYILCTENKLPQTILCQLISLLIVATVFRFLFVSFMEFYYSIILVKPDWKLIMKRPFI